jgi:hypothetical protein
MTKYNLSIIFFGFLFFLSPFYASASIGVGVGMGKIVMDAPLAPGGVYTLPSLPVINTGSEYSQYTVMVEYREDAVEMRPEKKWFSFDPSSFGIEPGNSQNIDVVLTVPANAKPGDYFAFLQAQPIKDQAIIDNSNTAVNIAAAAKLYFTVAPSNIFQAIYYKVTTLYDKFYPYDAMVLGFIIFVILIFIIKKKFNIKISSREKKQD